MGDFHQRESLQSFSVQYNHTTQKTNSGKSNLKPPLKQMGTSTL